MSAGCVRLLLNYSARAMPCAWPVRWSPLSRPTASKDNPCPFTLPFSRSTLCTAVKDTEPTPTPTPKKKKRSGHSNASISSVGRKIHHRLIQVIGESGDDMGTMHRSDALRLMDEQGLKLVLLSESQDPPVFRLMSGRQIHEEQLKHREKQKAKPAQVQLRELSFSSAIAAHDLSTKFKQVASWLEKKHHVRITVHGSKGNMDSTLESLVQQMEVDYGFVLTPKVIRNGQAATCILRPPSAKELAEKSKKTQMAKASSGSSRTKDTSETSAQP